jgi:hypothetical protein
MTAAFAKISVCEVLRPRFELTSVQVRSQLTSSSAVGL